jgi:hypothetical protein
MAAANDNKHLVEEAPQPTAEQLSEMAKILQSARESFTSLQDALYRMRQALE